MHTASLAPPLPPLLDDQTLATLRRQATLLGRVLAFAASSLGFAAVLWLILAGPGFGTDRASTAHAARVRVTAQR